MGRPCHKAAFRFSASAVVVAVAVVIPVASGIAAETKPSVVPAKLAAKWNRNVTAAVKVSGFAKRGVWSIVRSLHRSLDAEVTAGAPATFTSSL
jgi:hypothetical protein